MDADDEPSLPVKVAIWIGFLVVGLPLCFALGFAIGRGLGWIAVKLMGL